MSVNLAGANSIECKTGSIHTKDLGQGSYKQ